MSRDFWLFETFIQCHARAVSCSNVVAGGRRLLRLWLCRPSRDTNEINARLDAVNYLQQQSELAGKVRLALKAMPDLDRALGAAINSSTPPSLALPGWARQNAQRR